MSRDACELTMDGHDWQYIDGEGSEGGMWVYRENHRVCNRCGRIERALRYNSVKGEWDEWKELKEFLRARNERHRHVESLRAKVSAVYDIFKSPSE